MLGSTPGQSPLLEVMLDLSAWATLLIATLVGSKYAAMGVPEPATGWPFLPLPEFFAVESPQMKIVGRVVDEVEAAVSALVVVLAASTRTSAAKSDDGKLLCIVV